MAKKSKNVVKVDMTDVKAGGIVLPEGDYIVEVSEVEMVESKTSGSKYLKWEMVVTEGTHKGAKLWHNTSLQQQALFNLKGVLISCGVNVPEGKLDLDLDDLEGRIMGVTVKHEEYEGKAKARIVETFPIDDTESAEDDEEGDDSVSIDDMDLDELIDFAKEQGIELELSKKDMKKESKVREAIKAAMKESEDEEDDEEEQEDGEEDSEDDEVDLESMDLKELLDLAEEKEISIPKKHKKDEDKVREIISEALKEEEEESEGDDEEVDLDEMDEEELLAFAKEQGIKLTSKQKKSEKTIRKAIQEAMEEEDEE